MNKEWFIFKGTHHLGPFTKKEMEEFFLKGEIELQSLVWREGDPEWQPLNKTKELLFLIKQKEEFDAEMPPEIPPEVLSPPAFPREDFSPPLLPKFLNGPEENDEREVPPPLPLDVILPSFADKKEKKDYSKWLAIGVSLAFFFVLVWFFSNERSSSIQIRIKGLMPVYVEKLQSFAEEKSSSFIMNLALSLDGKILYGAANKGGELETVIKLKSIPTRILGTTETEIIIRGTIKNHLGEFTKMQFSKGDKFIPGEYQVDFIGRKIFFLNRYFNYFNNNSFFKKLNTLYRYQTNTLIYSGTPREFEKKLLDYRGRLLDESLKPLNDKLEYLQTFQSLLNKTVENYFLTIEKIKNPKEIKKFEMMYIKEISPVVQSLVVVANEALQNIKATPADKIILPEEQIQRGKEIGELASDMITETEKSKRLNLVEKTRLRNYFEIKYQKIKLKLDGDITKIQMEIEKKSHLNKG